MGFLRSISNSLAIVFFTHGQTMPFFSQPTVIFFRLILQKSPGLHGPKNSCDTLTQSCLLVHFECTQNVHFYLVVDTHLILPHSCNCFSLSCPVRFHSNATDCQCHSLYCHWRLSLFIALVSPSAIPDPITDTVS